MKAKRPLRAARGLQKALQNRRCVASRMQIRSSSSSSTSALMPASAVSDGLALPGRKFTEAVPPCVKCTGTESLRVAPSRMQFGSSGSSSNLALMPESTVSDVLALPGRIFTGATPLRVANNFYTYSCCSFRLATQFATILKGL